ncbi:MAG: DUF433 domain-containing protein [Chloroflexota bacterium]|nr:MAG: DUF433 domain-containing protein [Chloroflexota bacterium]
MAVMTPYFHVELNDDGVPMLSGTTMKVIELVLDHLAYGWSPEELQYQHPYLTMGQVYSALAYYWDNRQEFDAQIDQDLAWVQAQRQARVASPFVQRLRAIKYK